MFDTTHPEVRAAVERALAEDIGSGDITSQLTIPENLQARGKFLARQPLVLAGIELLPLIYEFRGGAEVELLSRSGASAQTGDVLATVSGKARTLLECERVALNFLQRLSGIATLARQYVDAVAGRTRVLDTRKTTPGLRQLEKMAAAAGGVANHRIGLFDAILIKNNHITAAGGVRNALERTKHFAGPVEIEVRTRAELDEALSAGAKHLLLDNLSPAEAAEWVRHVAGRAITELSGRITLENIRTYAEAAPDFISCGAITHSAAAAAIRFRLQLENS
ncbi:MAG: carboxylating nicotinate-nucleotide diphosphorylase [Bryobacteraceae bacterium]